MDQAHLAQLLMRHRTALHAYIFASVRSHNDAEDILQNVSLKQSAVATTPPGETKPPVQIDCRIKTPVDPNFRSAKPVVSPVVLGPIGQRQRFAHAPAGPPPCDWDCSELR
jgi:hypothetical protein